MGPNISRWIISSIANYFDTNKGDYVLFVEGFQKSTQARWAELRVDGPFLKEVSKGCFYYDVEINLILSSVKNHEDGYGLVQMAGYFQALFVDIPVFKNDYITNPDPIINDGSLLGCLRLNTDKREYLRVNHFGQVRPDTDLFQSSVEGHYRLVLDT